MNELSNVEIAAAFALSFCIGWLVVREFKRMEQQPCQHEWEYQRLLIDGDHIRRVYHCIHCPAEEID